MVPAYAICLAVLYGFRRYFFEHLVFATHFVAFVLIWILAAGIPLNIVFRAVGLAANAQRDQIISLVLLLGLPDICSRRSDACTAMESSWRPRARSRWSCCFCRSCAPTGSCFSLSL